MATKPSNLRHPALVCAFFVSAVLTIAVPATRAQTLDTGILGTVTDEQGTVVPGATVTFTQPATGFTRTVITGPDGGYEVRYLRPGEYAVEVQLTGFRTERRTGITLQLSQLARIDVRLRVGEIRDTVEVTAAPPLLQTEGAVLGEVIGTERVVNLPLNGRNFLQLSNLTPGVVVREEANAVRTRVVANGSRDIWMQVNINGISAVNNRHNFVNFYPSIDAIEEFKVQSGNYSAEYGGNSGANINMQLRPGTNKLHGSVFEFLRNDHLDARGYFRPRPLPKDILRRNQFGAVLSGPILRDKTFFMIGYEGMRSIIERAGTAIVLTPEQRRGDFSAVSTPINDPFTGNPFPGNIIPTNRLNPVSVNLINNYMPLPNVAGATNYAGVTRDIVDIDQGLARIDHSFSPRDQVSFHYIHSARHFPNVELNPFFSYNATFPNTSLGIQHVRTFSATFLNELRFGWHKGDTRKLSPRTETDFTIESLGISGLKVGGPDGRPLRADEQGFPVLGIEGFLGMGDSQASSNLDNSRTYQLVDNLSFFRGAHSMKAGFDVRRHLDDATTNNWPFGNMSFTRDVTGNGAAAFMLGYPRTILTPEGVPISKVRQWRWGVYFQDDWKASSNLTLNLGLRYDLFALPKEVNGVSRTLRFDLDPVNPPLYPQPGEVVDLWINEYNYLSPRFGFAWRVGNRNVVRGGYGIFRTAAHFDNVNILQLNPGAGVSLTITNNALNPVATIQNPVPRELFPQNPTFNVVTLPADRKRRNAYVQNWNFQLSHQLTGSDVIEAGWVGSKGTFIDTSLNHFNNPEPSLIAFSQARRPFPQYNRIRMMAADGNSIYHSLQSRYERRFAKGLSFTAAYTWSHMIDDTGETINRGACQCQSPRNRGKAERADSLYDIRHRFVAGYVWEIPWAQAMTGVARTILAGWQAGGIITLQTGSPFNITQSGDTQNVEFSTWSRPHLVPGTAELSDRDPAAWFNTGAFLRSVGVYGTSPRNPLVGPGLHTFDLSVSKAFPMPFEKSHELLFRTEFFNAFNTPQFGNPGGVLGTGTFGRVTGTRADNRQVQFALKYTF
jgi:hypothetical protein